MNRPYAHVVGCLAVALVASAASAEIVGVTGELAEIEAPPSVVFGQCVSTTEMRVFEEQQDITLTEDLQVTITSAGTYANPEDLTPGVIPAGTVIRSYFLNADPNSHMSVYFNGSVTFDGDILGIMTRQIDLDPSDAITGALGTTYPYGQLSRGLELGAAGSDQIIVESDLRTLTVVRAVASIPGDQIRVITAVPEPTTLGLLALGGAALLRRRR